MNCCECDKPLNKRNIKFCNKSCAAKFNNRKRKKKERYCAYCKNEIKSYQRKFCSPKCHKDFEFQTKTLVKFFNGELYTNDTIRGVLIFLFGNKCFECGIKNEWNNKSLVLHVDHIDGDSDNCKPENLRLLCPNCHSQTPTYCGGRTNKKNTKRNRYLRKYKNGVIV